MRRLTYGANNNVKSAKPIRWAVAFVIAIALLGTVGWLNWRHVDRMQQSDIWVRHTEHVRESLDILMLQLQNVQGNERGYIVTADPVFLSKFEAAIKEAEGEFREIKAFTEDNPTQKANCARLEQLVSRIFQITRKQVALRKTTGFEAAREDIASGEGRRTMAAIGDVLGQMDEEENTLYQARLMASQREVRATRLFTVAGTGVSLIILAVVFVMVAQENILRQKAQAELDRLNQELKARAAQVEEANKELESFSYSVSHDLRAPLRHVHGYVEMLQRATEGQLSDKAKRYLKTIADASIEMGQLIDDLLAFSQMGRVEMQQTRIALNPLVHETVEQLEMQTRDRKITWNICPLPDVYGDESMIKQVLANLIGNAVKYTRKREHATIEIRTVGEEHGDVILCVRDNGAGFDMRYAHKLFGVFQRLHRADEFEGTGIGLATVRRIIARHGGRTWAEGKLGAGASFYFTLKTASNKTSTNDCTETNSPGGRQSAG